MTYLILANIAVWLGLGGYLFYLATVQNSLERKVRQLEIRADE